MFVFQFAAAVLTATHIRSASALQPGSDYDLYPTVGLYNCSGHTPVSNVTARNAFDSLPQIDPSSEHGWEQWSLFLHGEPQMIMRWNKGDPSVSTHSSSYFDIVMNINGTTVQGQVQGDLVSTDNDDFKRISIGDNSLTWDADALWFNASVRVDGYEIQIDSFSATLDGFHPDVALYNGLLDQSGGWYGSVPLIRGHVTGTFVTPSKENVTLDGLSVMRHMFSETPLPLYITAYSGATAWGYSTAFYDTHVFYQTETTNGTVHQAAYLGRAIPQPGATGMFSSAWATYGVTDDPLYTLAIDASGFDASLAGCADTNHVPYLFNATSMTPFGTFTDNGGGVTTYYTLGGTTRAAFNGTIAYGTIEGFFEAYAAPSAGS